MNGAERGYEAYRCKACNGTGATHDSTMHGQPVGPMHWGYGMVPCTFCSRRGGPRGVMLVLAGIKPNRWAGERMPEHDVPPVHAARGER